MRFSASRFYGVTLGTLAGCSPQPCNSPAPKAPAAVAPAVSTEAPAAPTYETTLARVGLSPEALDRNVNPCTDFYEFACGSWIASTQLPADEAAWTRSFDEINRRNELDLRTLLENAVLEAARRDADPELKALGTFYEACMDEAQVESLGVSPIAALLKQAKQVGSGTQLSEFTAKLHALGYPVLFLLNPVQDSADATRWIADLDQGGLGLPDREYYLASDEASVLLKGVYQEHVSRMLSLAGISKKDAKIAAPEIVQFETELARVSKTKEERRDPRSMFNRFSREKLLQSAPKFDWDVYFRTVGLEAAELNVTPPAFFEHLGALASAAKPTTLQHYLTWHIVRHTAPLLSKAFVDEAFEFQKTLTGQAQDRPRWRRCVAATNDALGDTLGKQFSKLRFSAEDKRSAEELVEVISGTFAIQLDELTWMDVVTRDAAKQKLEAMAYLIGYPERPKAYDFPLTAKAYAENSQRARSAELKRDLAKIGHAVDRKEWQMTAPTVNAYYDPQRNHMVFPAGILQPPFFDRASADAVNLGAMGMVVGHELTHGFDDEGAQYDASGNLRNWWTEIVGQHFVERTGCLANQYSTFETRDGLKVNGKLTLGENIADLGGIKLAFNAHRALSTGGMQISADGYSADQLFFISLAQTWCTKATPEYERMLLQVDPHSPPRFRVNGPLANYPEFAEAFACPVGSPMHKEKACTIW